MKKNKFPKYDISDSDLKIIVEKSKGYSGSDMMNVCKEASMMSIRSVQDRICSIDPNALRAVNLNDFLDALKVVKPTVSEKTLTQYVQWNTEYGSFQFDLNEIDN